MISGFREENRALIILTFDATNVPLDGSFERVCR